MHDSRLPTSRYLVFFGLVVVGCAVDLLTKHLLFSWPELERGGIYWLWEGHAGFQTSLNEGALFGLGQGLVWLYVAMSVFALVAIVAWMFGFGGARQMWLTVALGCVSGGILGNLYDRLGLPGLVWQAPADRVGQPVYAVRDWILVQWNDQWRWPNFNVADSLLVVGAGLVILHALLHSEPRHIEEESGS